MSQQQARVLLVMPAAAQEEVMRGLRGCEICFCAAADCEEFRRLCAPVAPEADVAVVALSLPDGNWYSVYRTMAVQSVSTELIVALPVDAGDTATLAALGVWDVIRPPYEGPVARRTLLTALERKHGLVAA